MNGYFVYLNFNQFVRFLKIGTIMIDNSFNKNNKLSFVMPNHNPTELIYIHYHRLIFEMFSLWDLYRLTLFRYWLV